MKNRYPALNLHRGESVRIRNYEEIASTLGDDGTLEGLPFQAEMQKYCGQTFRVLQPIKKLIIENANIGLRGIRNTVILEDVNCVGESHASCSRYCFFLWKEAWLSRSSPRSQAGSGIQGLPDTGSEGNARPPVAPSFYCQSVGLERATFAVSIWNLRQYLWDITDNRYPLPRRISLLSISLARRIWRLTRRRFPIRLSGLLEKTPSADFDLQPGDLVEVKCLDEIRATLDDSGKNRGLAFTKEMKRFCGRKFSVLRTVDRIIIEGTRENRKLAHTVILKDANCDGSANFSCPRYCYLLWRKIWLRKA